jgi:cellulose biosynthesis protein BcsQ
LPRRNYAIQTRLSPGTYECLGNKTLEEVRQYFNPQLQLIGYVFTMSEPTLNTTASLQILRQTYTEKVVRTVIPRNTDLRNAHFNKQDIFAYSPRSKAALAYDKLIRELFLPDEEGAPQDYEEEVEH